MKTVKQFMQFGIVGVINTLSSWVVYYPLIFFKVDYILATTLAYFISSIIGYLLNKVWVFKSKEKKTKSLVKYYVVYISSYFLNIGCMYLFVQIMGISTYIAPILVLFVTVPYNYLFSRFWVFKSVKYDENKINELASIHTFAICAYKDSPYLEECIKSIVNQKVKTNILLATSTPSKFIKDLANKYNIPYYVRDNKSDIQDDWNFAVSNAKTELVTVAHQDDHYEPDYTYNILANYKPNIIMYNTNYFPYKNGKKTTDINNKVRAGLKCFIKHDFFAKQKFFRVASLALGNTVCCPSVTYNMNMFKKEKIFTSIFKFDLDWDTFLKIYKMNYPIKYIPEQLVCYRIHDGATTKKFIVENTRQIEDIDMFNKFWPKWVTKIIMKFYVKCYDTYGKDKKYEK